MRFSHAVGKNPTKLIDRRTQFPTHFYFFTAFRIIYDGWWKFSEAIDDQWWDLSVSCRPGDKRWFHVRKASIVSDPLKIQSSALSKEIDCNFIPEYKNLYFSWTSCFVARELIFLDFVKRKWTDGENLCVKRIRFVLLTAEQKTSKHKLKEIWPHR